MFFTYLDQSSDKDHRDLRYHTPSFAAGIRRKHEVSDDGVSS